MRLASPAELWTVASPEGVETPVLAAMAVEPQGQSWPLSSVSFMANDAIDSMCFDTGTGVTCVSLEFVKRAKLHENVRALASGEINTVYTPSKEPLAVMGRVNIPLSIQLMLRRGTTEVHLAHLAKNHWVTWLTW